MVVSGDGKQLELNGAGWALGPPLKHGQTTLIMELGKAVRALDLFFIFVYIQYNYVDFQINYVFIQGMHLHTFPLRAVS